MRADVIRLTWELFQAVLSALNPLDPILIVQVGSRTGKSSLKMLPRWF